MTLMLTVNVLDRLPTCNSPLKKPKTVSTCTWYMQILNRLNDFDLIILYKTLNDNHVMDLLNNLSDDLIRPNKFLF